MCSSMLITARITTRIPLLVYDAAAAHRPIFFKLLCCHDAELACVSG